MDLIDRDDTVQHGVDCAGKAGEGARYGEGYPFVELHVIPYCCGTFGVLSNGLEDQSQRRVNNSLHGDNAGQEHHDNKYIKVDPVVQ